MAFLNGKGPNAKTLNGMGIYHDKRKRTIYSAFYMKNGYVIANQDVIKYTLFSCRFMFTLFALVLAWSFSDGNIIATIGIPVCFLAAAEGLFHAWFLPSLIEVKNFEKPESEKFFVRLRGQGYVRLGVGIVLMTAAIFLIAYNAQTQHYTGFVLYANYALSVAAGLFVIVSIYLIIWKLTHKDNEPKLSDEEKAKKLEATLKAQMAKDNKRRAKQDREREALQKEREAKKKVREKEKAAKAAAKAAKKAN